MRTRDVTRRAAGGEGLVRGYLACCLVLPLLGCGGAKVEPTARDIRDATDLGRTVEPGSAAERAVLAELDRLPADSPRKVQGVVVVAGPPYHSASGRVCRSIRLTAGKDTEPARVACTEGQAWFFVPNVFEPSTPMP